MYFILQLFNDLIFFSEDKINSSYLILSLFKLTLYSIKFKSLILYSSLLFLNLFFQWFHLDFVLRLFFLESIHFVSVGLQLLYRVDIEGRLKLQRVADVLWVEVIWPLLVIAFIDGIQVAAAINVHMIDFFLLVLIRVVFPIVSWFIVLVLVHVLLLALRL